MSTDKIKQALRALKLIKDHVVGDKHPKWGNDDAVYASRGYIADLCDGVLAAAPPAQPQEPTCTVAGHIGTDGFGCVEWKTDEWPAIGLPLYASPPRAVEPLTDEQLEAAGDAYSRAIGLGMGAKAAVRDMRLLLNITKE